jgi:hypothetical protein
MPYCCNVLRRGDFWKGIKGQGVGPATHKCGNFHTKPLCDFFAKRKQAFVFIKQRVPMFSYSSTLRAALRQMATSPQHGSSASYHLFAPALCGSHALKQRCVAMPVADSPSTSAPLQASHPAFSQLRHASSLDDGDTAMVRALETALGPLDTAPLVRSYVCMLHVFCLHTICVCGRHSP